MIDVSVKGANAPYERRIRSSLSKLPEYYLRAARLSHVEVSTEQDVKEMMAIWDHGTRRLRVYPNLGVLLDKVVFHELTHAVDDNFGYPHYFSGRDDWKRIHAAQMYFDIPKYRDQPLEYFADTGAKYFIIGGPAQSRVCPDEVAFFERVVLSTLQSAFGG